MDLGTITFKLGANVAGAVAGIKTVMDGISKAAVQVRRIAREVSAFGALATAAFGAVAAAGATKNAEVYRAMEQLKATFQQLAGALAQFLLPAIRTLAQHLAGIRDYVNGLSPAVRQTITHFVTWAAEGAVLMAVLGKVTAVTAGLVQAIAKIGTMAISFAPIIIAVGFLGGIFGWAYHAWHDSSSLIGQELHALADQFTGVFGGIGEFVKSTFAKLVDYALTPLRAIIRALGDLADSSLGKKLGLGGLGDSFRGLAEDLTSKQMMSDLAAGGKFAGEQIKYAAQGLKSAIRDSGLSAMIDKLISVTSKTGVVGSNVREDVYMSGQGFGSTGQSIKEILAAQGFKQLNISGGESVLGGMLEDVRGTQRQILELSQLAKPPAAVIEFLRAWQEFLKKSGADVERVTVAGSQAAMAVRALRFGIQEAVKHRDWEALDKLREQSLANRVGGTIGVGLSAAKTDDAALTYSIKFNDLMTALGATMDQQEVKGMDAIGKIGNSLAVLGTTVVIAAQTVGEALANKLLKAGGLLGGVLQNFQKGGGGFLGAFIALLEGSRQFKEVETILNTILQRVADTFGKLIGAIEPLLGAVGDLVNGALTAISPLFDILNGVFSSLAAAIEPLSFILIALEPIFKMLGTALALAFNAVATGLDLLFPVLKFVAQVALNMGLELSRAWNAVLGAIQGFLRSIGLTEAANGLNSWKSDTAGLTRALQQLNDMTLDSAKAQAAASANVLKLGDAANQATESLTNVPTGYKLALARYMAAGGEAARGSVLGGTPTDAGSGPAGGLGSATGAGSTNVAISLSVDGKELNKATKIQYKISNARDLGSSLDAMSRFGTQLRTV